MNVRRSIARASVVLAAPVLSLGLASCSYDSPTDMVYNPAVGVNDQDGSVDVLNAVIVSGTDGSGTVVAGFANNDQENDDQVTNIEAAGDDQGVQVQLGGSNQIPAGGFLDIGKDGGVTVSGEQVAPGGFVTLRFSFDRGAAATLDVPVVANDGPYAEVPTS